MPRDINKRLGGLSRRRSGVDRMSKIALDSQIEIATNSQLQESWQKRAPSQSYTRYALGAMQEVDAGYTHKSLDTAERVGQQLKSGLALVGIAADFRLQGSVPLNVHIRGVSDVDLLTLDGNFFTYVRTGALSIAGHYYSAPTPKTSIGVLSSLRTESEKILKAKYPAAEVDTSGAQNVEEE